MNAKRMLLRFLIGNETYDRLVRMNVIQDAGVVGRRARGHKASNQRRESEPYADFFDPEGEVPDHMRWQLRGELPEYSLVDYDYGLITKQ